MPQARLSDVIREHCAGDGPGAYAAFKTLATLEAEYPAVAAAVRAEAELRPTMGGPDGVLEKIARPCADEILTEQLETDDEDDQASE